MGIPECEHSLGERGCSLQQEEDEVTESKIGAFLDEKSLELKRLQTPLYEELYETSTRSSEIPASTGPAESFIAPLNPAIAKQQKHSPSKSPGSLSGRSIGIRSSQESEKRVRQIRVLGAPVELEHLLPVSIVPLFWKFLQQG
jgi:hypothetical protein